MGVGEKGKVVFSASVRNLRLIAIGMAVIELADLLEQHGVGRAGDVVLWMRWEVPDPHGDEVGAFLLRQVNGRAGEAATS